MSYCDDESNHHYQVKMDLFEIDDQTMTDEGVRVGDLYEIDTCSLTPGEPSPIGRTEDGDLVHPMHPKHCYFRLDRRQIAELAHLHAKAHDLTKIPADPNDRKDPAKMLLWELLLEAVPKQFFDGSNHQRLAYESAVTAVLNGDWENYPIQFK